jgi:hypothetical protein
MENELDYVVLGYDDENVFKNLFIGSYTIVDFIPTPHVFYTVKPNDKLPFIKTA